jgi:flavin-dependent dehydrogenase
MSPPKTLHIVGAGPAGLAAAITAARAGAAVIVHEKESDVGRRFHGDFQGLENWTSPVDIIAEIESMGIEASFDHIPHQELVCFDPLGRELTASSSRPLYYLVRRGAGPGTLDRGLLDQALDLGVEVRFEDRVDRLPEGGIVATGPRGVDAIAVGYLFETSAANGAWVAIDQRLAPGGYAYLLIHDGQGTLASCMFEDFHREAAYLERTLSFFTSALDVQLENPRRFSGYGNFELPRTTVHGELLTVGEAAGFQDTLWGFGLRYALATGHMAARAFHAESPESYDEIWRRRFAGQMRSGAVNRVLFGIAGDRIVSWILGRVAAHGDPHAWLHRLYAPSAWKAALYPLARRRVASRRRHRECLIAGCDCTWCRCQRHKELTGEV